MNDPRSSAAASASSTKTSTTKLLTHPKSTNDLSSGATSLEKRLMSRLGPSGASTQLASSSVKKTSADLLSSTGQTLKKSSSTAITTSLAKTTTTTTTNSSGIEALSSSSKRKKTLWEPDSDSEYDLLSKAAKKVDLDDDDIVDIT